MLVNNWQPDFFLGFFSLEKTRMSRIIYFCMMVASQLTEPDFFWWCPLKGSGHEIDFV